MEGQAASGRTLRAAVDAMLADGATLREIEDELIVDAPVGGDARDALWLYAWGSAERQRPAVLA
jgi:hypothetical protein